MAEENNVAKLVFEKDVFGEQRLIVLTTAPSNQALVVKAAVPAGSPFWWWVGIENAAGVIGCNFTDAPIREATDTVAILTTKIESITVAPSDKLTWAEPEEQE